MRSQSRDPAIGHHSGHRDRMRGRYRGSSNCRRGAAKRTGHGHRSAIAHHIVRSRRGTVKLIERTLGEGDELIDGE